MIDKISCKTPGVKLKGGIFHAPNKKDFVKINNAVVEDELISFKARGILCYLLSKPACWQVRLADLLARSKVDGRDAVRSGVDELAKAGYICRERSKDAAGKFVDWTYAVHEIPKRPKTGIPLSGKATYSKTKPNRRKSNAEMMTPTEILLYEGTKRASLPGDLAPDKMEAFQQEEPLPF